MHFHLIKKPIQCLPVNISSELKEKKKKREPALGESKKKTVEKKIHYVYFLLLFFFFLLAFRCHIVSISTDRYRTK